MPGNSSFENSRLLSTDERPSSPNGVSPYFARNRRRTIGDLKILENDRMFSNVRSPSPSSMKSASFYRNRSVFDSDCTTISPRNSSSYRENRVDSSSSRPISPYVPSETWTPSSPSMGPGCYPWLIPNSGRSQKAKVSLPSEPVKIKLHKRNISFPVPPDEKREDSKEDSTLKIIGALKALSRKRLHTTESEEDTLDSVNNSKRRPIEFNSGAYSSHLISSNESSNVGLSDILEKSANANGSQNNSDIVVLVSNSQIPQKPFNNPVTLTSNKRPRATNDTGNQLSKRRNNEILSSLSSSIALLEQSVLRKKEKRHQETKGPSKKPKVQEMHCVEVQTLPSPIASVDNKDKKEDKGTATDKEYSAFQNDSSNIIVDPKPVAEKKVSEKMAAALLKSALKKLANSGDLLPSDTSATSISILSETSLTKSDVSISTSLAPMASAPILSSNLFSFGKPAVSAENSLCNGTVPSTSEVAKTVETIPTLKFSNNSGFGLTLPASGIGAIATTTPLIVSQPSSQMPALQETVKPASTVSQLNNSIALSSSALPSSNTFTFGSNSTSNVFKSPVASAIVTSASVEALTVKPTTQSSFIFGATPEKNTGFTFGSTQPPVTSSVPGQIESKSAVATIAPINNQSSANSGFPSSPMLATPQKLENSSALVSNEKSSSILPISTPSQPATTSPSKPGGFSFTPSSKFMFSTSTASATTTMVAAQSTKPVFSFGNSASVKQDSSSKLFGMPIPPVSAANLAPELTKPNFSSSTPTGGFSFSSQAVKDPPKLSGFPSSNPTLAIQKPEAKRQEGFIFGSVGQKPEAAASPFAFEGSSTAKEPAKSSQSTFVFGSSNAAPSFGTLSNKPNNTASVTMFGSTATTTSNLFGSTTGLTTASAGFGSQGQMNLGFKTTTTGNTFGSTSTLPPTTTMATQGFSTQMTNSSTHMTNSSFSSSTPVFGSSSVAFGSSAPAFGSGTTFGSSSAALGSATNTFGSNPPTFGAATASAPTVTSPAPAFGAGPSPTPQFGTGTFSSSVSAPAFGSTFPAPTFGSPSQPQATPTVAPFSFTAPAGSVAPAATSAFNFSAPQAASSQQPQRPLFQFGAGSSSQPPTGTVQPFSFSGGSAGPPAAGGYPMFSIGSGSSAPRGRAVLRPRKK